MELYVAEEEDVRLSHAGKRQGDWIAETARIMQHQNESLDFGFILQGFSGLAEIQIPLFFVFLLIYLFTLKGNILIISVIFRNTCLQSPMYFFLRNLSFLDITYSSVIQPKLLSTLITGDGAISHAGCITQLYFFMCLTCTEFILLTAMGYDRYVAICDPLHYPIIMNKLSCFLLAASCWIIGFLDPLAHTIVISGLPFCGFVITHFYCDYSVLVKLSCIDTVLIERMSLIFGSLVGFTTFSLTIISYFYIISTILKISSNHGRQKAFSTCVSHLTVVILFYGTVLITYMRPTSQYSTSEGLAFSVFYTVLTPMLNPLIYSLRNQDVRRSIKQILHLHYKRRSVLL
ncbi:olfactory receptor 6M1-like [Hyperolius riggenbachi]|uniref:olfactory receptor 6M1-like n=1 Tax=Hyperolius riggenbachi TaxID=752182 RepID=UPI0035A2CB87